jgi:coenzyme F420-dependent glucose-6-phosphate dehydrogenase
VPIYLAGSGPVATRFAGRAGDGFITTSGKGVEVYRDTLLPAVAEGAAMSGRTIADLDLTIEVKVSFDPDREAAMNATRHWGALALTPDQKAGIEDPVEMQRLADELPVERSASRFIVSTDPEEHVDAIGRYAEMGFTHLVFHAPGPDQAGFIRQYGAEILPRLRERFGP